MLLHFFHFAAEKNSTTCLTTQKMPLITITFARIKEKPETNSKLGLSLICSEDGLRQSLFRETIQVIESYGKTVSASVSSNLDEEFLRCELEFSKDSGLPITEKQIEVLPKVNYDSLTVHEQRLIHSLNDLFEEHQYEIIHPGNSTAKECFREVTFRKNKNEISGESRKRSRKDGEKFRHIENSESYTGDIGELHKIQREIPNRKRKIFFNTENGIKLRTSLHARLRHIPMTFDIKEESWKRKGENGALDNNSKSFLEKAPSRDGSLADSKVTTMRYKRLSCVVCEKKTRHFCSVCKAALHIDIVKPNEVSCWQLFHEHPKIL